jgi:hypothetical protein
MKNTSVSNLNLAQSAMKSLFFGALRQIIISRLCEKVFAAFGGRIFFLNRRVFHVFASQNHEKHVGFKLKFGAKRHEKSFFRRFAPNNHFEVV